MSRSYSAQDDEARKYTSRSACTCASAWRADITTRIRFQIEVCRRSLGGCSMSSMWSLGCQWRRCEKKMCSRGTLERLRLPLEISSSSRQITCAGAVPSPYVPIPRCERAAMPTTRLLTTRCACLSSTALAKVLMLPVCRTFTRGFLFYFTDVFKRSGHPVIRIGAIPRVHSGYWIHNRRGNFCFCFGACA